MFVDGVDVRDCRSPSLRGAIGFVPQEPFLFSDTLADNVAFGLDATAAGRRRGSPRSSTTDDASSSAAAVARLDKDVADFPNGYDTMVGERGITLSGGQKQRTALARAIAIDPQILILDDALSAVDTYTEEEILSRLRGVMRPADVDHRLAPHLDRARRRSDPRPRRGPHRRARHARRAGRGERPLRRAAPEAAARRGAGRVVSAPQDDEILGKAYDARLMRRLLAYLRPYWRQVLLAFVAIIAGAAGQLAQPYLIKIAIDQHIATGRLEGLGRSPLLFLAIARRRRSPSSICRPGRCS